MSILSAVKKATGKYTGHPGMAEEVRNSPIKVTVEKSHNGGYIAETRQGYGDGIKTSHPTHQSVARHIKEMCK